MSTRSSPRDAWPGPDQASQPRRPRNTPVWPWPWKAIAILLVVAIVYGVLHNRTGKATYFELNGSTPVAEKVSVSGAVGYQDVDYEGDYTTWNLGVGYALTDFLGVDLRYHDTDEHDFGDLYESRVVLGLKAAF